MDKQIHINLKFGADIEQAQTALQNLKTSLSSLTTSMASQGITSGITTDLQSAQQAAVQLKTALQSSMNVKTGQFDLSKFNANLKSMNTDVSQLKTSLVNIGPAGQQAFMSLAQSIMTAEIPTRRISASLLSLGQTLKNTAKWQLSSSVLHGFMSAIQTSYQYAQDLNESLNNIRIVTGQSAEEMDKFAAKANKVAKQLSTSTLEYTKAALIYYQQGLSEEEVSKRTDVTIKLANVSRQSAEEVSDQLTAIWNNFYNGSKSLEYYADVLTALGAATASSSDEIAGGLEKFAAIGETIGLSYEYAAAALATITSNTRQSEEVVGTALKTVFARIQGLNLGDTLDDGTTLNKYSQALDTIGVSIFNQNNELKNMDDILDDIGNRWEKLSKAQQTALAQTVAGLRQYTQFIALMDNWNDGTADSMKANLNTAYNSQGSLKEQSEIYAESWEGASQRAKAAAEEVYSSLLNDDFFINLTNKFADFLGLLDNFFDSMKGSKGLLVGLASILLNAFSGAAAKGLENMVFNFKSFIGLAQKEALSIQNLTMSEVKTGVKIGPMSNQQSNSITGMEEQMILQHELLNKQENLNEEETLKAKIIIEQNQAYAKQVELLGQAVDLAERQRETTQQELLDNIISADVDHGYLSSQGLETLPQDLGTLYGVSEKVVEGVKTDKLDIFAGMDYQSANEDELRNALQRYKEILIKGSDEIEAAANGESTELSKALRKQAEALDPSKLSKADMRSAIKDIKNDTRTDLNLSHMVGSSVEKYGKSKVKIDTTDFSAEEAEKAAKVQAKLDASVSKTVTSFKAASKASKENSEGLKNFRQNSENSRKAISNLGGSTLSWSQTLVAASQGAMSLSFAISSLSSLKTTWADKNIGVGEKLLQTFMSLGMAIPMLLNSFSSINKALGITTTIQNLSTLSTMALTEKHRELTMALTAEDLAKKSGLTTDQAQAIINELKIRKIYEELLAKKALMTEEQKSLLMTQLGITAEQAEIISNELAAGSNWKKALSEAGVTSATSASTAATWANVAATWAKLWPVLLVIAALAALALALKLSTDAYNADANAAAKAGETATKAAEEFENAQNRYQDFKDTVKEYKDIDAGLRKLVKGTQEYEEELLKANEAALKLIDSQNLIYNQDYYYDKNGQIKFETGVLEEAQKNSFYDMQRAQSYKESTAQRAKTANIKSDLTDFNRDKIQTGWDVGGAFAKAGAYTASAAGIGALIGTIWPGVGNAVGAAVGAIAGAIVGLSVGVYDAISHYGASTDQEEKAMTLLAEQYEKLGSQALEESEIRSLLEANNIDESLIKKLIELSQDQTSGLKEQIAAMAENTQAIQGMIEATVAGSNTNNSKYTKLTDEDQSLANKIVANRAAEVLSDTESDAYKNAEKAAKDRVMGEGNGWFSDSSEDKAYDEYLRIRFGADYKDNYRVVHRTGTNATLQVKEGNEWKNLDGEEDNTLSNKEVIDTIVENEIKTFGNEDQKVLNNLTKLGDILSKNITGVDKDAIYDIKSSLASETAVDLTLMSPDQIQELKNSINQIGNQFSDTYIESIQTAIDNYSEDAYKARIEAESQNIINAGAQDLEVTTGALEAYTQNLMENNEALANNKKLAAEMAVETFRFSKQLEKLENVVKDNIANIKAAEKNNLEYYESLGEVKKALEETFGLKVSTNFINADNIDLIAKAAEGNAEAIKELGLSISKDYVNNLSVATENIDAFFNETFKATEGLAIGDYVYQSVDEFTNHFNESKSLVLSYIDEIANASLNIGDNVAQAIGEEDTQAFVNGLNQMAIATNMSVNEMQSLLTSMGVQAKVEQTWVPGKVKVPIYETTEEVDNGTWFDGKRKIITSTRQIGEKEMEGGQYVASIAYDGTNPNTQITFSGAKTALSTPSTRSSGSSGSGGKSAKTFNKKDHKEKKRI